jgi:hypothetical protein
MLMILRPAPDHRVELQDQGEFQLSSDINPS